MKRAALLIVPICCLSFVIIFAGKFAAQVTGDVNSDGAVNALDVQLTINAALGIDIGGRDADINADGTVNALDVQLCINAALGITNGGNGGGELPPDPKDVATDLDPTVPTDIAGATEFIYTGDDPIQTDVAPGTIEATRVAVLRGKVTSREGDPLPGVRITILNHPEYGQTLTREDGMFDIVVNGGSVTVNYTKEEYLTAQRQIDVLWRNYAWLPGVVMIPVDPVVTEIDLTSSEPFQVAQGSEVTDEDGTRQATLLFPEGTSAQLVMPDGSTESVSALSVRVTEYTVGENGPEAMPAELPPTSAYTYCAEVTADEAMAAGATDVQFDQPIIKYVDNFLGFPVGSAVPTGYYDREQGLWVASNNGRVIEILGETGSMADLDTDGDGAADDSAVLAELGVTDDERQRLADLYEPGRSLWRVPIAHFTPWDCNWPYGPPEDAQPPNQPPPQTQVTENDPCEGFGSIVEYQNQVLRERIPIAGTPFSLNYRSDRVPGSTAERNLDISLSGSSVPDSLEAITLEIRIAGQRHFQSFGPEPNQSTTFTWDGEDGYGRVIQGSEPAFLTLGYAYRLAYYAVPTATRRSFARFISSDFGTVHRGSKTIPLVQKWESTVGNWDAPPQALGGWSLSVHHTYDQDGRVFYSGDGGTRDAEGIYMGVISQATEAYCVENYDLAFGPDGSLYICDRGAYLIRRVWPDGTVTTVAGNGESGYGDDDIPALESPLFTPESVAVGRDGSVYISERCGNRIRRVDADGIITTFAGVRRTDGHLNSCGIDYGGFSGDGGPAVAAELNMPRGLAVAPDGSLYFCDTGNNRVRRVGLDGIISTEVGTGVRGYSGDGEPAGAAQLYIPGRVAFGPDGSLYITDGMRGSRIRRVLPSGIITTVAGTGQEGFSGDGGPATSARINAYDVAVGPDGSFYLADGSQYRVRRVGPDGIITTIAGNGGANWDGTFGNPATDTALRPEALHVGPDGNLHIAMGGSGLVGEIEKPLPGYVVGEMLIPSETGNEVYVFTSQGRHLRTVNALTSEPLYEFGYDENGLLTSILDGEGGTTTIERDGEGAATAIVGPYGQRTALDIDDDGLLETIANPNSAVHQFAYRDDGLLTDMTDPNGNTTQYDYDDQGRLVSATDAVGGVQTLTRTDVAGGFEVAHTTALGMTTTYQVTRRSVGGTRRVRIDPAGLQTELVKGSNGQRTVTAPNGTVSTIEYGADPRFGMQAPVPESVTVATPGGLSNTTTVQRSVTLDEPNDPLSVRNVYDRTKVNGREYRRYYDARENEVTTTSPVGREILTALDDDGRPVTQAFDPLLDPVSYAYDNSGHIESVVQGAQSWTYAYDTLGRLAERENAAGQRVQLTYDGADRLTGLTLPSGRTYGYSYDANRNLVQVVMPSGAAHGFGYTEVNLQDAYLPPGGSAYGRTYDLDRKRVQAALPSGRTVDTVYDTAGRPTGMTYDEAGSTFTYDDSGSGCCGSGLLMASVTRTPAAVGAEQSLAFDYDGPLVTEMVWIGAANGQFAYTYDNNFFLTGVSFASGSDAVNVTVTRDTDGLPTTVGPFAFTRSGPMGAVSEVSDGTLSILYSYDGTGRILARSSSVLTASAFEWGLVYNNAGKIMTRTETVAGATHTYQYTYDADGQLTEVTRDGTETVEQYTYDVNGNRTSTLSGAASYDAQDRLTNLDGTAYAFDVDGYLTGRGTDTFAYSARGELIAATVDGTTITYSYDSFGRRVGRNDASGSHEYLYGNPGNPFQVSAVRDSSGLLTFYYYDEYGYLVAFVRNGAWYYVATDQVGSPRVVTDNAGTPLKVVEYDSFGVVLSDSAPSLDLPIGFAGGLTDSTTGLIRFGLRDYGPQTGRWTARDPALMIGSPFNLYVYVTNDPVNWTDPSGLAFTIGGSLYEVFGGGGSISIGSDGITICGEVGLGYGAGINLSLLGDRPADGQTIVAGASAGPASAAVQLNDQGQIEVQAGIQAGAGVQFIWNSDCGYRTVPTAQVDLGQFLLDAATPRVQARVAAQFCGGVSW